MNITMNRAELLSAAQKAAAIASESAPLESLKGALLETSAASNTLTITATNIETSLEQKLSCPTGEDDAVVMNAKLLAGMLRLMSGETVELRRLPESRVLSLRSGETAYEWTIIERGEFPKMQFPFPEDTVTVRGIPSIARRTMFATEDNKDKPLLKCVNFMFTQEGLKGASYNGRSMVTAKGDDKSTGNASLLVPAAALEKLAELCTDQDEFKVGTTGPSIVFMRPGLTFSTRLMEGDFVDIGYLMGSIRNQFTVLSDVADLRRTLQAVAAMDPKGWVKLAFDGGRITFSCKSKLGRAVESMDVVPLTGAPQGEFWYLIPELMNSLKALSGTVTLGIAQAGMLDLSTEKAYYMQTAMREPVAAPVVVQDQSKAAKPKKTPAKAKNSRKSAAKKAA